MIFGIGTDIVSHARICALWEKYGDRLAERILHPHELPAYQAAKQPSHLLAKRFAAKEAFVKACGSGIRPPMTLRAIGVDHDALGKPLFLLDLAVQEWLEQQGAGRIHLSITDEREFACAFVVIEAKGN